VKGQITDPQLLSAIRPLDLSQYLRANGWHALAASAGSEVSEWSKKTSDGEVEISCPRHNRWRDYARRIREVLMELSRDEQRSEFEIFRDIQSSTRDVIRLRAIVRGRTDGTIPLEDGAQLARCARSLMLAAACSAFEPRRAYHTRKPPVATDYIRDLSLGQTEIGSFVMTVVSPVPPALHQTSLQFGEPPDSSFSRRVTTTLATALSAVTQAAQQSMDDGELTHFEEAVDLGVSADLCESLSMVNACTNIEAFSINIGWAVARPEHHPYQRHHEFTSDVLEVIQEAGKALRESSPIDSFEVEGFVIALERPLDGGTTDTFSGFATVLAPVERRPRKIRILVFGDAWKSADHAMRDRLLFRCVGELIREGKQYSLRNLRGLALIDPASIE
jgi:hypothetical protein